MQAWDLLEVAGIESRHCIALLDGRSTDQQVIGGERNALGRLFSAELARDLGRALSHGVYRNMLLQFIDEGAAAVSDFRRFGANHSMHEFGDGHRRDGDLDLAEAPPDERQQVFDRLPLPFPAMITLESRISPRRGDSMAGCAL